MEVGDRRRGDGGDRHRAAALETDTGLRPRGGGGAAALHAAAEHLTGPDPGLFVCLFIYLFVCLCV